MFEIRSSGFNTPHLKVLHRWFVEEWGEVDSFTECKNGVSLPAPILALKDGLLVGGLAFTGYNKPKIADAGLWICALLVSPENRGVGIASRLIRAAEEQSQQNGFEELYVCSDVPALYEKQNWRALYQKGKDTVLQKILNA